jgi:hypothetical protein
MVRWRSVLFASALAVGAAACGPDLNLSKALELKVVESGYFDAGLVDGKTHLLPSLTFVLHNTTSDSIASVQLLLSYIPEGSDGELDSVQVTGIGPKALAAGASTEPIVARATVGFSLEGARADFFTHRLFRDFTVKVFAKKRAGYMPLGEFKIDRRILEPSGKTPGAR